MNIYILSFKPLFIGFMCLYVCMGVGNTCMLSVHGVRVEVRVLHT